MDNGDYEVGDIFSINLSTIMTGDEFYILTREYFSGDYVWDLICFDGFPLHDPSCKPRTKEPYIDKDLLLKFIHSCGTVKIKYHQELSEKLKTLKPRGGIPLD